MSDYLENKLIDHIFRGVSFTAPTALHVALFTAAPSDSGGGTEVSGGSYARVNLAPSTTNWSATNSVGATTNPSSGTTGATSNNSAITFASPTANWGTVTHFGIFDAGSGGNLLVHGALTASKTINNGDAAPSFAVNALGITLA
jgi:hypothetical protein